MAQLKDGQYLFRSVSKEDYKIEASAVSPLSDTRNMGVDVIALFCNAYTSIADFEQEHNVKLPEDIAVMLTPSQA